MCLCCIFWALPNMILTGVYPSAGYPVTFLATPVSAPFWLPGCGVCRCEAPLGPSPCRMPRARWEEALTPIPVLLETAPRGAGRTPSPTDMSGRSGRALPHHRFHSLQEDWLLSPPFRQGLLRADEIITKEQYDYGCTGAEPQVLLVSPLRRA